MAINPKLSSDVNIRWGTTGKSIVKFPANNVITNEIPSETPIGIPIANISAKRLNNSPAMF
jgi:hypothetical protein